MSSEKPEPSKMTTVQFVWNLGFAILCLYFSYVCFVYLFVPSLKFLWHIQTGGSALDYIDTWQKAIKDLKDWLATFKKAS